MHMHAPGQGHEQGEGQGQGQGQGSEQGTEQGPGQELGNRENRELARRLKMDALLQLCTWASLVAAALLICTYWMHTM
jgi:hypothetical protein